MRSVRKLRSCCRLGHVRGLLKGIERTHESNPPSISAESYPRIPLEKVAEPIGRKLYSPAEFCKARRAIFLVEDLKGCDHSWISIWKRSQSCLDNTGDQEIETGFQQCFAMPSLSQRIACARG